MCAHFWKFPSNFGTRVSYIMLVLGVCKGEGFDCTFKDQLPCCPLGAESLQSRSWIEAKNRTAANPDTLLRMIANAIPIGTDLDIHDLSQGPVGAQMHAQKFVVLLDVLRIFQIDQRAQKYHMKYNVVFLYRDCRAMFSSDNDTASLFVSETSQLWHHFYHPTYEIEEKLDEAYDTKTKHIEFDADGLVRFTQSHVSEMACTFDFTEMPYDVQDCSIHISLIHGSSQSMEVTWNSSFAVRVHPGIKPPEWKVSGESSWQLRSGTFGRFKSTVSATFKFKREQWFSFSNYILPSILYWLASWLGLWISPEAVPARAAIGVIPVLVMTNKMNSLAAALPPISATTRLQSFMVMTLVIVTLQMLEFGVVHTAGRLAASLLKASRKKSENSPQDLESVAPVSSMCGVVSKLQDTELSITRRVSVWVDIHSRWIFSVTYVFSTFAILRL